MALGSQPYAFVRPVPQFLVRAQAQTLSAPMRHGAAGSLVAPASGTVSVYRPDGTALVSAAAITVVDSVATYALAAPAATEALGSGWSLIWTLLVGTDTYVHRETAYLCEYVPPAVVSVIDLLGRLPELRYRVPASQSTDRGDGTGWQPQIDATYYELLQRLLDDGRSPWLITECTGYREWMIARAGQRCVQAIPAAPDSTWAQAAKDLAFEVRSAEGRLRFRYSSEPSTVRRGGSPLIRLSPTGLPSW